MQSAKVLIFWLIIGSVALGEEFREVKLPTYRSIGRYSILEPGELFVFGGMLAETQFRRDSVLPHEYPKPQELQGVIRIPQGRRLSVGLGENPTFTSDEALAALQVFRPEDIASLHCCDRIKPESCALVSRFTSLKNLHLFAGEPWEEAAGAAELAKLTELKNLHFTETTTDPVNHKSRPFGSPALIEAILKLKKLRSLYLNCDKLTEQQIARLATHPSLEIVHLDMERMALGPVGLQAFTKMPRLRELVVRCTDEISNSDVFAFTECPNLEGLAIRTDAAITCKPDFERKRLDCSLHVQPWKQPEDANAK